MRPILRALLVCGGEGLVGRLFVYLSKSWCRRAFLSWLVVGMVSEFLPKYDFVVEVLWLRSGEVNEMGKCGFCFGLGFSEGVGC